MFDSDINFVGLSQFQSTYLLPRTRIDRESSSINRVFDRV